MDHDVYFARESLQDGLRTGQTGKAKGSNQTPFLFFLGFLKFPLFFPSFLFLPW